MEDCVLFTSELSFIYDEIQEAMLYEQVIQKRFQEENTLPEVLDFDEF